MIRISISKQCLSHRNHAGVWHHYPISTASQGVGNVRNSWQTPLGKHRIYQKIGENMPIFTIFRGRKARGVYQQGIHDAKKDWILSRILWLEGTQTGFNRRGQVDTRSRYIYIHGTHDEEDIGNPQSHGCIRMKNDDVIELFNQVSVGESVLISN
ncbi:MAG: L,D-transpeptidase [Mariprofundaceae bacterium]|nr:L,D-transpeptidase [Mariprofundaceae bacterium]